MTLNENTIRELLDAAEPAPWSVARLDLHRDTGVVDNEHAVASKHLAARAPELAADWLRMRRDLGHLARILEEMDEWAAQVEDRHNLPDSGSDLIAEKRAHAKLRAEVEKLRDRKLSLSKTQYQTARDLKNGIFDETFGTMPETHTVEAWEMGARTNQRTATALTRILEVDDG